MRRFNARFLALTASARGQSYSFLEARRESWRYPIVAIEAKVAQLNQARARRPLMAVIVVLAVSTAVLVVVSAYPLIRGSPSAAAAAMLATVELINLAHAALITQAVLHFTLKNVPEANPC